MAAAKKESKKKMIHVPVADCFAVLAQLNSARDCLDAMMNFQQLSGTYYEPCQAHRFSACANKLAPKILLHVIKI